MPQDRRPSISDAFWASEMLLLGRVLEPLLLAAAKSGARRAAAALGGSAAAGINWNLVNAAAEAWARRYVGELVKGITDTTKDEIRKAVGDWISEGGTLDDLIEKLAPTFGDDRAELIASTEATRAYAEGNRSAWKSARVPRLRWLTVNDDRVCEICGPLHDTVTGIDDGFTFPDSIGIPPAHVACRCYIQPDGI